MFESARNAATPAEMLNHSRSASGNDDDRSIKACHSERARSAGEESAVLRRTKRGQANSSAQSIKAVPAATMTIN
jgi:hypothetical protein